MRNQLIQFPQQILRQIKCLRKISATDKFPCFSCFDDRFEKITCKSCGGRGFIYGSHPMVQFSQDFIQKKINYLKKQQQDQQDNTKQYSLVDTKNHPNFFNCNDSSIKKNTSMQIQQQPFSFPILPQIQSGLKNKKVSVISSQQQDQSVRHNGHCCDQCQQDPIVGYRYHCDTCDDYDLCPKCYRKVKHSHDFIIYKEVESLKKSLDISKHQFLFKNLRKTIKKRQ